MSKLSTYLQKKQDLKNKKETKKTVSLIRKTIPLYENKTLDELKSSIQEFRLDKRIESKKLIHVYAITTVAIKLIYNIELYDVQLEGAITLNNGKIAEMKTGEGKTITSSLPVILNALDNHVHVVTVNPYLAKRDKEELEKLYSALGFTTGLNTSEMKSVEKKLAYECDIMYSTASELGFDYLRDNMVTSLEERVNPYGYNFALIDEVDLVLIDEARTPLIIGKPKEDDKNLIIKADNIVKKLLHSDYEIDPQSKGIALLSTGIDKIENFYSIDNLYSQENIPVMYRINQALLANYAYQKDIDYAIARQNKKSKKEIVIIDKFTGRLFFGRRFTNGLHQAIEAKHRKEGIQIQDETQTVATITLQNYFRSYSKLAGMSGTAKEEAKEFNDIYGLEVVEIKPNKPLNRKDFPILILEDKQEKWDYVLNRIKYHHDKGRPVLIGTVSVEDSEVLSNLLKNNKLNHSVLNAKQDKSEAEIIKNAGKAGQITVATNMAGRGTDIKVDKNTELVVILTELNESLRIDNQLKGRTSRQGAYGITETILSIHDTIFEKTNVSAVKSLTAVNPLPPAFESILRMVQEELESSGYSSRNNSLKYDDVIREQRNLFYKARNYILETKNDLEKVYKNFGGKHIDKINDFAKNSSLKESLLREYLLYALDNSWVEHIDKLEKLKDGISWRSYNGSNPIIIYQNEAKELWEIFLKDTSIKLNAISQEVEKLDYKKMKSAYERKIL